MTGCWHAWGEESGGWDCQLDGILDGGIKNVVLAEEIAGNDKKSILKFVKIEEWKGGIGRGDSRK